MNGKTIVIDACLGGTDSGEDITLTKDSDETLDSSERVLNAYDKLLSIVGDFNKIKSSLKRLFNAYNNFKDVLTISNHINACGHT